MYVDAYDAAVFDDFITERELHRSRSSMVCSSISKGVGVKTYSDKVPDEQKQLLIDEIKSDKNKYRLYTKYLTQYNILK